MGKAIILVTMGMSVIITVMIINLNVNTNAGLSTTVDFFKSTKARLIANSGVEIYLEKLRRDKTLTGNFLDNDLMEGEYDVYISGPDSLLSIRVESEFMEHTHASVVSAKRTAVTIPTINSAIYVSSENLTLKLNGNMDINGNDHNMDGTLSGGSSLPGIAVDDAADSAFVVNDLKPKISNAILGTGGSPSVSTVTDNTDWLTITENFIFAADINLTTGTYSTGTVLGTAPEPKITYVNGDVNFSGSSSGYGIMVINGNVEMSGNFTFKGIIIAYGQSTIVTKTVGNAGIFGSAIFVGQNVDIQATGNASFYYSKESIDNAKNNLKSSRFEILSWWE